MGKQSNGLDKSVLYKKGTIMKIGNIIYYFTKYTGIKYLVDKYHKLRGTKCDCNNRRKKLNEIKIDRW